MAKLKVTDWITIEYTADEELSAAIEKHRAYIMNETRAVSLKAVPNAETFVNINGKPCKVTVRKADKKRNPAMNIFVTDKKLAERHLEYDPVKGTYWV